MPLNLQLNDANFSLGPESGFFYSCSFSSQALLKLEGDGDVVGTFPVARSTFRTDVLQLHFDGTFFWTLEQLPSDLGISIKKWRLLPVKTAAFSGAVPVEFRWIDQMTLIHRSNIRWDAQSFAVEHYHRSLTSSFLAGASTIRLNDVTNINSGTELHLGPSGFGGFVGNEESVTAISVNSTTGDVTFSKTGGLENSYTGADPVNFVINVWIFNDHQFSGDENEAGTLLKFSWPEKQLISILAGGRYANVTAADFDSTVISWARAFQILQLDLSTATIDLSSSQEANIIEDDLTTPIIVYDLISDLAGLQHLKLQDRETTETAGNFITTVWPAGTFNFQSQTTAPIVNSVAMEFSTRVTKPFPTLETINVTANVRDQFNFPVFNKTLKFSSSITAPPSNPGIPGTFSLDTVVTNISGVAETVYTPSTTPVDIIVDIKAEIQ